MASFEWAVAEWPTKGYEPWPFQTIIYGKSYDGFALDAIEYGKKYIFEIRKLSRRK